MSSSNDRVIEKFRDNGGLVEGLDTKLVLIHSTGAARRPATSASDVATRTPIALSTRRASITPLPVYDS